MTVANLADWQTKVRENQAAFKQARKTDKTAFICTGCGEVKSGWGERTATQGWACCRACADLANSQLRNFDFLNQ